MASLSDQVHQDAIAFYDRMFDKCRLRNIIERSDEAAYTLHNPGVADGKQAFIDSSEPIAMEYPADRVAF